MTNQKGQWHLIKAVKILREKYHLEGFKVYILGTGELFQKLDMMISNNQLGEIIEMKGFVNYPQIYMKNCDLFVFPSLFEGLGNVILEALSFGMPVISADCPHGPRELLSPSSDYRSVAKDIEIAEYGVLVPPFELNDGIDNEDIDFNDKILAEAIYRFYIDKNIKEKYMVASRKRANDFILGNIINEWMKYI